MKHILRLLLTVSLVSLAGCLQIDTLITVRGDGSGTVREQVRLSQDAVEMIRQMEEMMQSSGASSSKTDFIDREQLDKRTRAMGPGVKLVSVEEMPGSEGFGYEAVWSFENINTLRVEQDAERTMPSGGAETVAEDDAASADMRPAATFRLEPGTPAVLHVLSTLAEDGGTTGTATGGAAAVTPTPEDEQVPPEMVREMFKGMRFRIAVEVEGGIVETNASHRAGSRVTLFELDFDRLLKDPKALTLLSSSDQPDPARLKQALRGVPGLTVETAPDLRIAFVPTGTVAASAAAAEMTESAPSLPSAGEMAESAPTLPSAGEMAESAPAEASAGEMGFVTGEGAGEAQSVATVAGSESAPAPAKPVSATPTGSIAGYSWRPIPIADLGAQRFNLVAVTDADGVVTKGMVTAIDATRVQLRRASMDGGGTVSLPLASLRAASVFGQTP